MPKSADLTQLATFPAAPDLTAAAVAWLQHLAHERRLSAHTIEAYGRDAAVLALCYGAGLRISEALSIRRADAPIGEAESVSIVGKGQKSRSAPIIAPVRQAIEDYLSLCPYALKPDGPLFVGAKGGPL